MNNPFSLKVLSISLFIGAISVPAYACQIPKSYYSNVFCTSHSSYFIALKDSGQPVALINSNGKRVADLMRYDAADATKIQNGLLPVQRLGKVGYVNTSGVVVIPLVYELIRGDSQTNGWARAVNNDRIIVKKNGKFGVIDTRNRTMVPFSASHISISDFDGQYAYITTNNGRIKIDKFGNEITATNVETNDKEAETNANAGQNETATDITIRTTTKDNEKLQNNESSEDNSDLNRESSDTEKVKDIYDYLEIIELREITNQFLNINFTSTLNNYNQISNNFFDSHSANETHQSNTDSKSYNELDNQTDNLSNSTVASEEDGSKDTNTDLIDSSDQIASDETDQTSAKSSDAKPNKLTTSSDSTANDEQTDIEQDKPSSVDDTSSIMDDTPSINDNDSHSNQSIIEDNSNQDFQSDTQPTNSLDQDTSEEVIADETTTPSVSNEEFLSSNEELLSSNEEFLNSNEEFLNSNEEFLNSNDEFINSNDEFINANDEFINANDEFINPNEQSLAIEESTVSNSVVTDATSDTDQQTSASISPETEEQDITPTNTYTVPLMSYDEDGWIPSQRNNKWGFVNHNKVPMIRFVFDNVTPFSEGLAGVQLEGDWGFINLAGDSIIPFKYQEANVQRDQSIYQGVEPFIFKNGKAWVGNTENGIKICINKQASYVSCDSSD